VIMGLAGHDAGIAEPKPSPGAGSLPGATASLASTGDSITAGVGSCFWFLLCGKGSWATGTDPATKSLFLRFRRQNPPMVGQAFNFARWGAHAADLPAQAEQAVRTKARYVTILIGANDACDPYPASPEMFREDVDRTLEILLRGLPKATVLVASTPNLYQLWKLGHANPDALAGWHRFGALECPALLSDATSASAEARQRRGAVATLVDDYNDQLEGACRAHHRRCVWDQGRTHAVPFTLRLVSKVDYFHPNAAGQRRLAEAAFPAYVVERLRRSDQLP